MQSSTLERRLPLAFAASLLAAACARTPETVPPSTPAPTPLEAQLERLAELGITPGEGLVAGDLFAFHPREAFEAAPYTLLTETLARAVGDEGQPPRCDRLWTCKLASAPAPGAYAQWLERLEHMTGAALGLEELNDGVGSAEDPRAWVSFQRDGAAVSVYLARHEDSLDPSILGTYADMLRRGDSGLQLFVASERPDSDRELLLAALKPQHRAAFSELTGIALAPLK